MMGQSDLFQGPGVEGKGRGKKATYPKMRSTVEAGITRGSCTTFTCHTAADPKGIPNWQPKRSGSGPAGASPDTLPYILFSFCFSPLMRGSGG